MDLKTQLKNLIKEKNYSISYVARAINVSTATLHLWINDNYKGKVEKVTKAMDALKEKYGDKINYASTIKNKQI